MARFFEKFVAFGTDIVGLERLMRLVQSICVILTFYPSLIPTLAPHQPASFHRRTELGVLELTSHLNLTRRAIRLFWCLGSFQSSWSAYVTPEKSAETWLSIMADSFFGLFGFMESVTLLDLFRIKHLSFFGYEEAVRIDTQSQGLWLAALSLAILSSGVKISRAFAAPSGRGTESASTSGKTSDGEDTGAVAEKRSLGAAVAGQEGTSREIGGVARKLAADVLDFVIPAWTTGLAPIDLGVVGVATLLSTLLTGYAVWERCGRTIERQRT